MSREQIVYLPIEEITTAPQVRQQLDPEPDRGLAVSIRETGLLHPLRVRWEGDRKIVVDGARRLAAVKLLGWTEVPAIVESRPLDESEILQKQLVANCQRADLLPVDLATAVDKLIRVSGLSATQAGVKLGFSNAKVSRLLSVLSLPEAIREQVQAGTIPASAAYELARVEDPGRQAALAEDLAGGRLTRDGLAGMAKAERNGQQQKPKANGHRARAALGDGRSITVVGADTLDGLIAALEELLSKARKARPQGLGLATFLKMLKDQSAS